MSALALDFTVELGGFCLEVREELLLEGITGLFGPSGSGKTSLLRVVAGLETGARGSVSLDGTAWQGGSAHVPPHDRGVGYVFQDGRLFPHLSVAANLGFAPRHGKRSGPIRFDDVVAALDLSSLLERDPTSLSGGERQRVAIGRALLANPRLLLMDEPVSSLDLARKREIVSTIATLPKRFGLPVVYVTHDVDELVRLADRIVLLREGRVIDRGSVKDVLERNDLSDSIEPVDAGVVIEAVVGNHTERMTALEIGDAALRIPRIAAEAGTLVRIRIHARDVVVATEPPGKLSIRNVLPARIVGIATDHPTRCEIRLRVGGQHLTASITYDALDDLGLESGQQVYALIKSVALDGYPLL